MVKQKSREKLVNDFSNCDLRNVSFENSNLEYANFARSDLRGANLTNCNLRFANFENANLDGSYMMWSDLTGSNLSPIWKDLRLVVSPNISEIGTLYTALEQGKIDGSTYSGECSCLSGTLAKTSDKAKIIPDRIRYTRDSNRPIERFFCRIEPGDTIDNSWDCEQIAIQLRLIYQEMKSAFSDSFIESLPQGLKQN